MIAMSPTTDRRIKRFCYTKQGECRKSFFLHSMRTDAVSMFVWTMMAQ